jgi:ATP-dependent helicase/nuclease subunit A
VTTEQQTFTFISGGQRPSAVQTPRRNKVIEAGAGTGKTTAIVAEVLKLLLGEEEIAPERIILVTFTEKAAGEIADRIESALNEIEQQLQGESACWPAKSANPMFEVRPAQRDACRRAIERQLARIDGLRSQTIHSFCQTLLRQYPIEAGVDPQFRITEGFDRSLLYGQLYDEWIDDETRLRRHPEAASEWEALLEHYGYLFQARAAIFALVDKRHLLLDRSYTIGTIAEYEPALRSAVATYSRYYGAADPPPQGSSIDAWIDYFAPMAGDLRKSHLKGDEQLKDCLRVLRGEKTGACVYDLLVSHRAAVALLSLTRRFIARLDEGKRKRGLLDFDDLLIRTRMLLDNPSALDRIRKQYDYIFVDEFQDTDRVQAEIFDRLARDASGNFVPGKTIVVGDPKQSIYAFRRADPETYRDFTQSLVKSNDLLIHQHRSTPELVQTLNAIGRVLFADRDADPNVFQPEYHDLRGGQPPTAVQTAEGRCPPLTLLGCEGDAEVEAESIVAWIRERDHSNLRRFALLFRRKGRMEEYLDVFDKQGLSYVVPPMGLFLDRPAAVDLLAVLRAIAYRYDRGALISAARSPYFALTDVEIADPDSPAWKAVRESLEGFRDAAKRLTITELIDYVIATTGIESVCRATRDSTRSLRHLEQVRAIAFIYDQKAGGSVRQFVEEIARRREVPEEVEPSLLDETTNAVRILTIHGAKGLEFDTVIIPDIEFSSSGNKEAVDFFTVENPRSLVLRNGLETLSGICRFSGEYPLKEIAGMRDKAELRRLFYVAITRAESQVLIVCNSAKVTNNGFGRFLKEILNVDSSDWPAQPGSVVHERIGIPIVFEKVESLEIAKGAALRLQDAELEKQLAEGPIVPCIVPQPEPIALPSRAEVKMARAAAANRAAGILLHRVLERWDGTSEVASLLAALAVEQAADSRSIELVRRRLTTVAASPVFRRIVSAETIGREMPIAFLDESGALVQKRIDRLIRENGTDTVIDYKSGAPSDARFDSDREQVGVYCRAVAQMTGRPCRGLLWYIDAENDTAVDV